MRREIVNTAIEGDAETSERADVDPFGDPAALTREPAHLELPRVTGRLDHDNANAEPEARIWSAHVRSDDIAPVRTLWPARRYPTWPRENGAHTRQRIITRSATLEPCVTRSSPS